MAVITNILIADRRLGDDQLATLPLTPRREQIPAEAVMLTPSDQQVCVAHTETSTTIDEGSALPMEPDFVFPTDDGEGEPEIDGDVLIELLPLIAGLLADVDVFEVEGEGFDSMSDDSDDLGGVERPAQGSPAETEEKKQGFFSRLFGS
ncbi:hypothetical protein [Brevibacterium sp. UCMA 11754]|uniref:hypothetical protein n=1 Tax=Brevibacterium sp. UCMA 11754 TaxID=2749198 RepID=UPI001F32554D|nr:hypothetical protein [Brevibacterium sp. UCMA 11754]MCF2574159.1 hypothetical protein [Brevibacterium sp. UCMA 11754]